MGKSRGNRNKNKNKKGRENTGNVGGGRGLKTSTAKVTEDATLDAEWVLLMADGGNHGRQNTHKQQQPNPGGHRSVSDCKIRLERERKEVELGRVRD